MKIAVVCYSYTGTTKKYVELLQEKIGCDVIYIKPVKEIKSKGFASYFAGGLKVMMNETPELVDYSFDQNEYDYIILATPVWAYTYAPAMKAFMLKEKITNKKVSYLMTHRGDPRKAMEKFVEALSKNEVVKGLDLNAKDSEVVNTNKLDAWISQLGL